MAQGCDVGRSTRLHKLEEVCGNLPGGMTHQDSHQQYHVADGGFILEIDVRDFWGVDLVEVLCKTITGLLNRSFTLAVGFHDVLHGFPLVRGMQTASLEAKLLKTDNYHKRGGSPQYIPVPPEFLQSPG